LIFDLVLKLSFNFGAVHDRVARFFLVHDTKTGKMYQKHKMYKIVIKYPECL
jgi:hypothetical protein